MYLILFNLKIGDLNEKQRLYINWQLDPGYNRKLSQYDIKSGLHDWALWRTKLNENLIISSLFHTPLLLSKNKTNFILDKEDIQNYNIEQKKNGHQIQDPTIFFKIDPKIARFIYCFEYGRSSIQQNFENEDSSRTRREHDPPLLDPESYMFYGLPRIKIKNNYSESSRTGVKAVNIPINYKTIIRHHKTTPKSPKSLFVVSTQEKNKDVANDSVIIKKSTVLNKMPNNENLEIINQCNTDKQIKNVNEPIITGINVKEKVKAFEHVNKQPNIKTAKPTETLQKIIDTPSQSNDDINIIQKHYLTSPIKFAKNKSLLPENRLEETNKKSTSSIQSSFFNSSASFFLGMKIFFNFK